PGPTDSVDHGRWGVLSRLRQYRNEATKIRRARGSRVRRWRTPDLFGRSRRHDWNNPYRHRTSRHSAGLAPRLREGRLRTRVAEAARVRQFSRCRITQFIEWRSEDGSAAAAKLQNPNLRYRV